MARGVPSLCLTPRPLSVAGEGSKGRANVGTGNTEVCDRPATPTAVATNEALPSPVSCMGRAVTPLSGQGLT